MATQQQYLPLQHQQQKIPSHIPIVEEFWAFPLLPQQGLQFVVSMNFLSNYCLIPRVLAALWSWLYSTFHQQNYYIIHVFTQSWNLCFHNNLSYFHSPKSSIHCWSQFGHEWSYRWSSSKFHGNSNWSRGGSRRHSWLQTNLLSSGLLVYVITKFLWHLLQRESQNGLFIIFLSWSFMGF